MTERKAYKPPVSQCAARTCWQLSSYLDHCWTEHTDYVKQQLRKCHDLFHWSNQAWAEPVLNRSQHAHSIADGSPKLLVCPRRGKDSLQHDPQWVGTVWFANCCWMERVHTSCLLFMSEWRSNVKITVIWAATVLYSMLQVQFTLGQVTSIREMFLLTPEGSHPSWEGHNMCCQHNDIFQVSFTTLYIHGVTHQVQTHRTSWGLNVIYLTEKCWKHKVPWELVIFESPKEASPRQTWNLRQHEQLFWHLWLNCWQVPGWKWLWRWDIFVHDR